MELVNANQPMKKQVGTVTPEERDTIRRLYERKNGLIELFRSIADVEREENGPLYDRIVQDMADTTGKYQGWFDTMGRKYGWENVRGHAWEIDFDTCCVFLKK